MDVAQDTNALLEQRNVLSTIMRSNGTLQTIMVTQLLINTHALREAIVKMVLQLNVLQESTILFTERELNPIASVLQQVSTQILLVQQILLTISALQVTIVKKVQTTHRYYSVHMEHLEEHCRQLKNQIAQLARLVSTVQSSQQSL